MRLFLRATLGALTCFTMVSMASAQASLPFSADYVVSLYGLTIARASFTGEVSPQRYNVDGTLRSAGIARIFDRTDATARATGRLGPGDVSPERFVLEFVQGGRRTTTDIAFRGGAARANTNPAPSEPSEKTIPVSQADLRSVVDPVSATLLARGTPEQICGRTLRIFEGGTRIDVRLSLKEVGFVEGVGNRAVTCTGSFVPVSGYERDNGTFAHLRENGAPQFVYAPVADGLYSLHSLSVRTEIGQVSLQASRRQFGG